MTFLFIMVGFMVLAFILMVAVITPFAWILWKNHELKQTRQHLLETGLRGEASVLSVEETGAFSNSRSQARIRLQVRLPGEPPYEATILKSVSILEASRIQPGATVSVAVSQEDRQEVVLDMSQPATLPE